MCGQATERTRGPCHVSHTRAAAPTRPPPLSHTRADLLDILSNGNSPVRVMTHMSKCFQAIEKLKLDNESPPPGMRPKGLGMVSCVGVEYVQFKSPLALEGKVRAPL